MCIWKILANTVSCLRFTAEFVCASYSRLGYSSEKGILVIAFCCFPTIESSFLWIPVLVDYSVISLFLHSVLSLGSSFISSEKYSFLLRNREQFFWAVTHLSSLPQWAKWGNNLLYSAWWTLAIFWEMCQLHWPGGSAAQTFFFFPSSLIYMPLSASSTLFWSQSSPFRFVLDNECSQWTATAFCCG